MNERGVLSYFNNTRFYNILHVFIFMARNDLSFIPAIEVGDVNKPSEDLPFPANTVDEKNGENYYCEG